jgi:hypothetical protein
MMPSPLSELINIGPRTSLYTPAHPENGQLIIISTWLSAARKHIAKFISLYQNIAPNSRILLIESNISILTSSYPKQRKAIQLAASAVLDTLSECSKVSLSGGNANIDGSLSACGKWPKILLHSFSNGGTNTATQLLIVLRERLNTPLPLIGLVCDSCPEEGTYWKSYDAMLLSLPKGFMWQNILGPIACQFILIILYTGIAFGNENPASLMRRTILDPRIVEPGWKSGIGIAEAASAGRVCYIFSKEDRMCYWEDVVGHAEQARAKGWQAQEVLFVGSAHCAHLKQDEQKYLDAIKGLWDATGAWKYPPISKL